jgi:thioesterase domain-containing protein
VMRDDGVTTVHFVPSMLEVVLEEPGLVVGDLRRVICSGEALSPAQCERFFERLPGVELHNLYGPTEAAVDVSWHVCRPGEGRVPIGRPVASTRLEVLDEGLHRLPVGARGELCIGGVQLARGYVNRPGLTAERFVPDPFSAGERLYRTGDLAAWRPDGEIEYLGRTDDQVKIRGMRVEPGEVEAALIDQPEVRSAVVVAREGRLVAYLVTDAEGEDWRRRLRATLPEHMIPTAFVPIEAIPTTANGKLDRTRLPAPVTRPGGRDPVPPRDPIEARLALLFEETLGVDIVGVHDDFFELGGHSLLTLRLTMRIRQELGRDLPVATVLASPTVAGLAAVLRRPGDGAPPTRIVPLRETGERTPIFLVHALGGEVFRYMPLVRRLGADQPVYGIAARGLADGEEPHATLAEMVDDYVGHIRTVRPGGGPYVLGGYCIGGNIALEVARRLRAEGEPVPLVAMFYSDADEPVVRSSLEDDDALTRHALAGAPLDDLEVDQDALDDLGPDERLAALMSAAARRDLQPEAADLEQARRYLRVFGANAHAVGHVRHEPYDGRVALFAPTDDRGVPDELGWRAVVTGRLAVAPIPGDRFHILYEPLVADAAAELRGWMDRDDAD